MSLIGALDQLRSGDISAFVLNCLLVSAFTYVIPPVNLLVFIPPYSVILIGILKLQENDMLKTTYITNATFFFITALILSTVMFKSHLKQLSDECKLEIANKKLDELALKDQLMTEPGTLMEVENSMVHGFKITRTMLSNLNHSKMQSYKKQPLFEK